MSIQDDIFDIEDTLKSKANKKAFERILDWAFATENELTTRREQVSVLKAAIKIVDPDICKRKK